MVRIMFMIMLLNIILMMTMVIVMIDLMSVVVSRMLLSSSQPWHWFKENNDYYNWVQNLIYSHLTLSQYFHDISSDILIFVYIEYSIIIPNLQQPQGYCRQLHSYGPIWSWLSWGWWWWWWSYFNHHHLLSDHETWETTPLP